MATAKRGISGAHAALLRGVNVGGKNKLPMKDLTRIFTSVGCSDVRTYIQSGNVVFRASATLARRVPKLVTAAIHEEFGIDTPIIVRSRVEFEAAIEANPFLKSCAADSLCLGFLADAPTAKRGQGLAPDRSPGDRFALIGRELYLHLPNGAARSKLTNAWFDRQLATTSTMRNWRTVTKIAELLAATGELRD